MNVVTSFKQKTLGPTVKVVCLLLVVIVPFLLDVLYLFSLLVQGK
jgi:hypothetical protein